MNGSTLRPVWVCAAKCKLIGLPLRLPQPRYLQTTQSGYLTNRSVLSAQRHRILGHPAPHQGCPSLPLTSHCDGLRPPLTRGGVPGLELASSRAGRTFYTPMYVSCLITFEDAAKGGQDCDRKHPARQDPCQPTPARPPLGGPSTLIIEIPNWQQEV
jgi:hypothetical protein